MVDVVLTTDQKNGYCAVYNQTQTSGGCSSNVSLIIKREDEHKLHFPMISETNRLSVSLGIIPAVTFFRRSGKCSTDAFVNILVMRAGIKAVSFAIRRGPKLGSTARDMWCKLHRRLQH